ncbi:TetR/AcrR family transcriptional regulator [Pseudomonas petrae]|uniref:TetR/AcrR family transcriptional regulator n=1 Tax=Pseudomonas petrae TaxID=2912190 RepID=UPI001F2BEA16|nr:TetR/AcrR family transcriptional regulator [Pseudomonas petrae]MCF7539596.1 TetR/AcrR family transcriptional regulator [Pseudomonas petrae]
MATQAAILQGATQVLAAHGLAGFNTNAVAERAGASIGTLYQYFPNKDALMLALIREQKQRMLVDIARAMRAASGRSLDEAVRLLIRGRLKHLRDGDTVAGLLSQQEMRLPIHDVRADYLDQGCRVFMAGLTHWASAARGIDPQRAAKTVPALVRGVVESWADAPPHRLEIAEEEAVHSVLSYLRYQRSA